MSAFGNKECIGQRLVMLLEAEGQARLALWQTKLIMTEWTTPDTLCLPLNGLNLDKIRENIVTQIVGIEIEQRRTLDEQIAVSAQREKLLMKKKQTGEASPGRTAAQEEV